MIELLKKLGLLDLATRTAVAHGATLEEVAGRSRRHRIVVARHAVWTWLRSRGWSYPDIGDVAGVDHTTVLAGVRASLSRGWRIAA